MKKTLTVCDKLLLAASDLDEGCGKTFTAEDLVVAAWRRFPRVFGLRGHINDDGDPEFPDSNRVFAEIMGSKPIRKRGLLVKVASKTYQLTTLGREAASGLQLGTTAVSQARAKSAETQRSVMSREVQAELERLLSTRAARRAQNGELDRLTFHDACMFWNITPRSTAIELEGSLAEINALIQRVEQAIQGGATELRSGRSDLPHTTAELVRTVHDYLQAKFRDELDTIRKRRDQRSPTGITSRTRSAESNS